MEAFATEHYDRLDIFLSMTEGVKAEAGAVAEKLFSIYTNRQPTQADVARVFSHSRSLVGDNDGGAISYNRVKLLAKAFETANFAAKPGDWRYIEGVLAKMYQRGQTTSDEADDFDDLWVDLRRNSGHG